MKQWYSKIHGLVNEKPEDWKIDKKTIDGQDVFIGDKVRVYDGDVYWGVHTIVENSKNGGYKYADPLFLSVNHTWKLFN